MCSLELRIHMQRIMCSAPIIRQCLERHPPFYPHRHSAKVQSVTQQRVVRSRQAVRCMASNEAQNRRQVK